MIILMIKITYNLDLDRRTVQ